MREKNPSDMGYLGIEEPVDKSELPFEPSLVNHHVCLEITATLREETIIEESSTESDSKFQPEYKRKSTESNTFEINGEYQIEDATEVFVILMSTTESILEWTLPEEVQKNRTLLAHESSLTLHASPILYREAAQIAEWRYEDRTKIGTLLDWIEDDSIPGSQVTKTRALCLELSVDGYEFGERDKVSRHVP